MLITSISIILGMSTTKNYGNTYMAITKKSAAVTMQCVACGCCVKVCPLNAVSIYKGMNAVVDRVKCVGCGKCAIACPASVISIVLREAACNEN